MHMHYTVCYALQRGKSLEVSCEPTILHNISKAAPHCNALCWKGTKSSGGWITKQSWNQTRNSFICFHSTTSISKGCQKQKHKFYFEMVTEAVISEAGKSDEKAHCDALRKISSWVESPFLQCALFASYHHIHNHLHHSQLSLSKRKFELKHHLSSGTNLEKDYPQVELNHNLFVHLCPLIPHHPWMKGLLT